MSITLYLVNRESRRSLIRFVAAKGIIKMERLIPRLRNFYEIENEKI